jgi:hypothetical protein
MVRRGIPTCVLIPAVWLLVTLPLRSQSLTTSVISSTSGGFTGTLVFGAQFGYDITSLGDLDGDGVGDIAVATLRDSRAASRMWILFMDRDGSVKKQRSISDVGRSIAGIGRNPDTGEFVLADGIRDAFHPNPPVRLLSITSDGRLSTQRPLRGPDELDGIPLRGWVASVGDLNSDGLADLAIGDVEWLGNALERSIVFALMGPNYETERYSFFSYEPGPGPFGDQIGRSIVTLEDVEGDGTPNLIVGSPRYEADGEDVARNSGAVWMVNLAPDDLLFSDPVRTKTPIRFDENQRFLGQALANLGDLDKDGVDEIAVGAPRSGPHEEGAVFILYFNREGLPRGRQRIDETTPGMLGIEWGDRFGSSLTTLDLDGDGYQELAVGAPLDDNGREDPNTNIGAVWILGGFQSLAPCISPASVEFEGNEPSANHSLLLRSEMVAAAPIQAALHFRRGGDQSYFTTDMTHLGAGTFEGRVPEFAVGSRGIEYFISAQVESGASTRMPASGTFFTPVRVPDGLTFGTPTGSGASAYRLISIPLDLDESAAREVLVDDLGEYDPAEWRLAGVREGELVEYDGQNLQFEPGRAFWMLTRQDNLLVTSGPGTSVRADTVFQMPLEAGWNLVGNPFNFEIPISNVRTCGERGRSACAQARLTGAPGELVAVYGYEGTWMQEEESIRPFEGYAVFADSGDVLLIHPDLSPDNVKRLDPGTSQPVPDVERKADLKSMVERLVSATDGRSVPANQEANIQLDLYPNPFDKRVTISYRLLERNEVHVRVVDILGREVVSLVGEDQGPGTHTITWAAESNLESVASGLYVITVQAGPWSSSRTVSLTRGY